MPAHQRNPKRWLILVAVMLAFMPIVIDMTVLHVAVPSLTQALGATSTEVLWIIDIYPLLMAGLLVPMGTLADRIGNRKVLLTGLFVFTAASVVAAFAVSPAMLIAGRILLALGGSMIVPCVLGTIRRTFEDSGERAIALGMWGAVGSAGAAIGPLVGGGLLEHFWWGSVFLINAPVMLIVAPACYFLLPRNEATTPGNWNFAQALPLIVGMIALVYAIKSGFGDKSSLALTAIIGLAGVSCLMVFVRTQMRSEEPMLDLSLFSHPAVVAGMVMAIATTGAIAGVELTLAQELQYVIGKSPLDAAIFMIPIMVGAAIAGPIAGYLSNLLGLRTVATASLLIGAGALLYLSAVDFHNADWTVPIALAIIGLSLSIGLTASSIAIMGSVEAEKGSAAGSLEATGYELGAGLGITIFGVVLSGVFSRSITLPPDLAAPLAEQAARSMGDVLLVAKDLAADQGAQLIDAGKTAFSSAHIFLLRSAGLLIGALAILVFFLLASYRPSQSTEH